MTDTPQINMQQIMHIYTAFLGVWLLFWVVKMILYIVPLWRIAKRAGLNPAVSLLALIPLIGRMVALYVIGFSDWKVAAMPGYPYAPGVYPPQYPPQPPTAPGPYAPVAYPQQAVPHPHAQHPVETFPAAGYPPPPPPVD